MNLLFDGFASLQGAMFLLAGMIFTLIGGGMTYFGLMKERTWIKVTGRMIGAKKHLSDGSTMYTPVYEFTSKEGETIKFLGQSGASSWIPSKMGEVIDVFYHPNNPKNACTRSAKMIGYGILIVGLVPLAIGIYNFKFSLISFAVLFTILGIAGVKILGFVDKGITYLKEEQGKEHVSLSEAFENAISQIGIDKNNALEENETFIPAEELIVKKEKKAKFNRISQTIMCLGLTMASIYFVKGELQFQKDAIKAQGIIKRNISHVDSEGTTMYKPEVTFDDHYGRSHTFTSNSSTSWKSYNRGDVVKIMYLPKNPNEAKIDKGIWNYLFAIIPGILALLCLLLVIRGRKK